MQPLDNGRIVKGWGAWRCPECGYVMTKSVLESIFEICEKSGAIKHIEADYYNKFLNCSDRQMEAVIFFIIRDRRKYINKEIFSNHWKTDNDIFEHITFFLKMIAKGIMGFNEKNGELVFSKPTGNYPPNKETQKKLGEKIDNSAPLIGKVLFKMLQKQKLGKLYTGNDIVSKLKKDTYRKQHRKKSKKPVYYQLPEEKLSCGYRDEFPHLYSTKPPQNSPNQPE